MAKSVSGFHDPRHVGGWATGDLRSLATKILQKEGKLRLKMPFLGVFDDLKHRIPH
jgi:hypothetical protein